MKLKDIFYGSQAVGGTLLFHFPFMIASLILAIKSHDYNYIDAITNLAWLYFFIHLAIVLTFCITTEFQMYRNLCRISVFLVTILYQVAVFYSITSYATLFKI